MSTNLGLVVLLCFLTLCIAPGFGQVETSAAKRVDPLTTTPQGHDWPWGEMLVTGATLLLVYATWRLVTTTRMHVDHTRALVEKVDTMIKIDRTPYLGTSIVCRNDQDPTDRTPRICLQNISRVPILVENLSLRLDRNGIPEELRIGESDNLWLQAQTTYYIPHQDLLIVWSKADIKLIEIDCNYRSIYDDCTVPLKTKWLCNHDDQTISQKKD